MTFQPKIEAEGQLYMYLAKLQDAERGGVIPVTVPILSEGWGYATRIVQT